MKFIHIDDLIVNMDEVKCIKKNKITDGAQLTIDIKYSVDIYYKDGSIDTIPTDGEVRADMLIYRIASDIREWNIRNERK